MLNDAAAEEFIRDALGALSEDDYAFSVECMGTPWDVYRLTRAGRRWTTAFRVLDGQLQVGLFMVGELTGDEVVNNLHTAYD